MIAASSALEAFPLGFIISPLPTTIPSFTKVATPSTAYEAIWSLSENLSTSARVPVLDIFPAILRAFVV